MRRIFPVLLLIAALSGCEFYRAAEPAEIQAARYVSDRPPSVTLMSMVNSRNGRAAHSALLINGSEQVIYDPAGTFQHPELPRAGDIHYGVTPRYLDYYQRYHARFDYYVHAQTVEVSRATADQVLANAKARGKTPKLFCAESVTASVRPVAPFQNVGITLFPEGVREDFAQIPGVQNTFVREVDVGKNNVWEQSATLDLDEK
ncbi:MAG: hypothetical protein AAGG56_16660 [Pseudomonadota bacterium]